MCGQDSQRDLRDCQPSDPLADGRKVLTCHPRDEAVLRPLAEGLGLRLHSTMYGPDPGEVYLFDPGETPTPRVDIQFLTRPVPARPYDPWAETKRRILDGLGTSPH